MSAWITALRCRPTVRNTVVTAASSATRGARRRRACLLAQEVQVRQGRLVQVQAREQRLGQRPAVEPRDQAHQQALEHRRQLRAAQLEAQCARRHSRRDVDGRLVVAVHLRIHELERGHRLEQVEAGPVQQLVHLQTARHVAAQLRDVAHFETRTDPSAEDRRVSVGVSASPCQKQSLMRILNCFCCFRDRCRRPRAVADEGRFRPRF